MQFSSVLLQNLNRFKIPFLKNGPILVALELAILGSGG
jgi:hypothetical protein